MLWCSKESAFCLNSGVCFRQYSLDLSKQFSQNNFAALTLTLSVNRPLAWHSPPPENPGSATGIFIFHNVNNFSNQSPSLTSKQYTSPPITQHSRAECGVWYNAWAQLGRSVPLSLSVNGPMYNCYVTRDWDQCVSRTNIVNRMYGTWMWGVDVGHDGLRGNN